jgi:phosphoribosylamine--glycine ligase
VVGPEEPLVKGIRDHMEADAALKGLKIIGPGALGAQLEGSKDFSKSFMQRHGIPTAAYRSFSAGDLDKGIAYVNQHSLPIVLKADGLAAGKGVLICQDHEEAVAELQAMLQDNKFGEAGSRVVIEEYLQGIEISVFVLTDGSNYKLLPSAKDYKRIGEADTGLNTGGMGAVSPVPFANESFLKKVEDRIVIPTIQGLRNENIPYTGFIFIGLMCMNDEPYVIEYNSRLGDPETEVVLPRISSDLVELFDACASGKLDQCELKTDERHAATVMLVSKGYPEAYEKGKEMKLPEVSGSSILFHAGTKLQDGRLLTNGGRVMAVTSFGESLEDAVRTSTDIAKQIEFEGKYFRNDIGYEFRDETMGNP